MLISIVLFFSLSVFGGGWTPTDCGLVVNLKEGDQILLSVMMDKDNNGTPEEYFVNHYDGYTGGPFKYGNGNYLKLIAQDAGVTEPSEASIWTVDTALTRSLPLGGISYTLWSSNNWTLTAENSGWQFNGALTKDGNWKNACDVILTLPTNRSETAADPGNTLDRGSGAFDGQTGEGFLGMTYREVYMMTIPRNIGPNCYTNASLVTFQEGNGKATYIFSDMSASIKRTLFRLYILNKPLVNCEGKYFFGTDEQNYLKYRSSNNVNDSTTARKTYTMDYWTPMSRVGETQYYQTGGYSIPEDDSTYYFVGYDNKYCTKTAKDKLGSWADTAVSQFTNIRDLRVMDLKNSDTLFTPGARAYGYLRVDTTSHEDNLGVTFKPAGYFLHIKEYDRNMEMTPNADSTEWTVNEIWKVEEGMQSLQVKAMVYTGPTFSETDPGADIIGWSEYESGTGVPVSTGGSSVGKAGWARIYTDSTKINGAIKFIEADTTKRIHYDNNNFIGGQVPDQYPEKDGSSKLAVRNHLLKFGFTFNGWDTKADGTGTRYQPGDTIDMDTVSLTDGVLTLYAQAEFVGEYIIALSFMQDGERYYMTHPGTAAPRFSRARHFEDFTNVWQGMANAENVDPNYINTFKLRVPTVSGTLAGERVFDPKREMIRGYEDSVMFYEYFSPDKEEYLGLYYTDPNTVVANNTWEGLFQSTGGWPSYLQPAINNTKLFSTHYLKRDGEGVLQRNERSNHDKSYVKYIPETGQFDGVATAEEATSFQITGVVIADGHYVILPDTTVAWTDEIEFGLHEEEQTTEDVWSKLIGKQLMACMMVGEDTTYFHPNRDKIFTTYNELRLSNDFRLTQEVTYIRDRRALEGTITAEHLAAMGETDNEFHYTVTSGSTSPMDITYGGAYADIVDTIRVTLRPRTGSRIKAYYGCWKNGAAGLHVNADGSRYRDILVTTKTYHYADDTTYYKLVPEYEHYNFGPLVGEERVVNFTLQKITSRKLLDAAGTEVREDITNIEDVTDQLGLLSTYCTMIKGGTKVGIKGISADVKTLTLRVIEENTSGTDYDTLRITHVKVDQAVEDIEDLKVPIMQVALEKDELLWSVVHNGTRYFITAGTGGLIYRQYTYNGLIYKLNDTKTQVQIGAKDAANSDDSYMTEWKYTYPNKAEHPDQLTLKTESPVNMYFTIAGETTPGVTATEGSATTLTFVYDTIYTNDNANYEEMVYLKYGDNQWLKFNGTALELTTTESQRSLFSWAYLKPEHDMQNKGTYPSVSSVSFGHNDVSPVNIQTRYQAYKEYTLLLSNQLLYAAKEWKVDIADLINPELEWKTNYSVSIVPDSRVATSSGLTLTETEQSSLTHTITPSEDSPTNITLNGNYVNIVDTLDFRITLRDNAPTYKFKDQWKNFTSIEDAHVKIPLVRKTYHTENFDSLVCIVAGDEYHYTFPSTIVEDENDTHTFSLGTERRQGSHVLDVDDNVITSTSTTTDVTVSGGMDLSNAALAEIRLMDEYGNTPSWCELSGKTATTVTVKCKENGTRSPRTAYLYFAYIVRIDGDTRFVNFRLSVSQASLYQYSGNQTLVHSTGASGDPLADGLQQVHTHTRILYYYPDQNVELPIRERGFFGWWRWFRYGKDEHDNNVDDADLPDSLWVTPPRNTGKYEIPFYTIGDSVEDGGTKKWVTMGRYTVFHNPSSDGLVKKDPAAKVPLVVPPINKATIHYGVDISNYYDGLPLQMKNVNQIDTAKLDTMRNIPEPTLSLRETFELRPWTEMAETMEGYKDTIASEHRNMRYMEDHEVMAPLGNRLLLRTEQRYNYANLQKTGHSESLMGYYMRDDNWSLWTDLTYCDRDTMIWAAGWDADVDWYTYSPKNGTYTKCNYKVTEMEDFLEVPRKTTITAGQEFDTVYYCLRSRSWKSTFSAQNVCNTVAGDYWFNICRYKVIYHNPEQYGPKLEYTTDGVAKAIITNDEIEQKYEVLERLNFDYNKPGSGYHAYPNPLPWDDASYGFTYNEETNVPDNRFHHDQFPYFPAQGEYGIINRIPYGDYWYTMEQHGGAENGYMIYCDGMSSAGQVAALSLSRTLCEGQKMYFSAYVGNPNHMSGKSLPSIVFSVQGSNDKTNWEDITTYMTGNIASSNKWYQIMFPINQKKEYQHFRIRIYGMSSDFDGNDFVIDDLCIYATRPPLVAYQANTKCVGEGESELAKHVVLRVDYQGIDEEGYHSTDVYYTIKKVANGVTSFIAPTDGYLNPGTLPEGATGIDTIYGHVDMPAKNYTPTDDEVFANVPSLVAKYEASVTEHAADPSKPIYHMGYVYEHLDNSVRPVMYIIHTAEMTTDAEYTVHMSNAARTLMNSMCALTSELNITNRMMLAINGVEQPTKEIVDMCVNSTYDLSLRVKGSLFVDSIAPVDLDGTCINDWLLYGETREAESMTLYGYKYDDIKKVIKDILRTENYDNTNQFASTLADISSNEMLRIKDLVETDQDITLSDGVDPYTLVSDLVNKGFLQLYRSSLTTTVVAGNTVKFVVFPIVGTGSDETKALNVEVCPTPVLISLTPSAGDEAVPLIIGGLNRNKIDISQPVVILTDSLSSMTHIAVPVDSIMTNIVLDSINLIATDDPSFREGVHHIDLEPDVAYNFSGGSQTYYTKGDTIYLSYASTANYRMRQGYSYTFNITLQTKTQAKTHAGGCPIGKVPMTISIVPDFLRWDPQSGSTTWNSPNNWIGITDRNEIYSANARFAPLPSTKVIVPAVSGEAMYPIMTSSIAGNDSIQQAGFKYNTCDIIRFLPGAAIANQQYITYNSAIADMDIPNQTWALRAAPVTGMISGDLFMAQTDLMGMNSLWEVGTFDANGRTYKTGNATFWLSVFNRATTYQGNGTDVDSEDRTAAEEWSKVTNGLTLSLPAAQGWAVYTHTKAENAADIRLPKNDDIYYYYYSSGGKVESLYEHNLQALRNTNAGGTAGKLAFDPDGSSQSYTITQGTSSTKFIFGNPTMGYIDIWGFISDNSLTESFRYIDASGAWVTVTKGAIPGDNVITNLARYLPPMHAIEVTANAENTSLNVTVNTSRVVTEPVAEPASAPSRMNRAGISKGIMTITAVNDAASVCRSRLLIGQGYHDAVREGEDALLTTVNIDKYSTTSYPATPFNIYASDGGYGLCIDLRSEIVNVPIAFYNSALPFEDVTHLWFTGVNNIDGELVLYDALTDTEKPIIDGICIDIETPTTNHEARYYIRRPGYIEEEENPVATGVMKFETDGEQAIKIIKDDHVLILRNGHVYSVFGQKIR